MIKAIIIDDEVDAVVSIELMLNKYCSDDVYVVGTANSVTEGVKAIEANKPDIIFLDIEMPHGSGFDLIEKYPKRDFDVIFITAYNQYAIKAFKCSAIDYILKPINIQELIDAIEKAKENKKKKKKNFFDLKLLRENLNAIKPEKIIVSTTESMEYVRIDSIVRIEADGRYSNISLEDGKKIYASKNLMEFQDMLEYSEFFRTHKSHLINLKHVLKYYHKDGGYVEMSDLSKVSISRRKKDEFIEVMSKFTKF